MNSARRTNLREKTIILNSKLMSNVLHKQFTLLCHQIAENVKFTSLISRDRKEIEMSNLDNYNAHVVSLLFADRSFNDRCAQG